MKREKRKKKRKEQVTLKGDKWVWYFFVSWCCCCFSNLSLKSSSCHEMEMKMDRGMCMKRKEWRDTGISSKYELQENNKRDQGEEGVKRGNIITSLTSISGWPASHGQKVERDLKTQKIGGWTTMKWTIMKQERCRQEMLVVVSLVLGFMLNWKGNPLKS